MTDLKVTPHSSQSEGNSYDQLLRSTSIVGGAKALTLVVSLVRTKAVALLLGPSGIGLISLFNAAIAVVSTATQLGVNRSGTRAVAKVVRVAEDDQISNTVGTLRWCSWLTGILGILITVLLAEQLSKWTFDTPEYASSIAILGTSILLTSLLGGETAILRGTRKVGDIARSSVVGAILTTVAAVAIYAALGTSGIVPAIIVSAAINLSATFWFTRKIPFVRTDLGVKGKIENSRELFHLGFALIYGPILGAITTLIVVSLINREFGLQTNGTFQAALTISALFTSFILDAMGTDFFPRLSAESDKPEQVNRLVNQQIEVGTLLALVGITATLCFAPFLVTLFYSEQFKSGSEILIWLALGGAFQTISWPVGMIQKALGAKRWIVVSQTIASSMRLTLVFLLFKPFGILGIALAYPLSSALQCASTFLIAKHLTNFRISTGALKSALLPLPFATLAIISHESWGSTNTAYLGLILTPIAILVTLKGLASLVSEDHKIFSLIRKLPGGSILITLLRQLEPGRQPSNDA